MYALRVGDMQLSGLEIYVLDPCVVEDAPFPGHLYGNVLHVEDPDGAWRRIVDGANSADDDGDAELRDALSRLGSRVIRLKGD
jgi:hypothetical protein